MKIEQLRELSVEELAQNLGIQNLDEEQTKKLSGIIDEYVDLVQNKVEQMSDIIKVVNNSLINNFDPDKDGLKFHAFNDLKNTFAFQLSNISDIKGRISEEMDNLLSDKMNPLSESLINTLLGQEESEQTLIIDENPMYFLCINNSKPKPPPQTNYLPFMFYVRSVINNASASAKITSGWLAYAICP